MDEIEALYLESCLTDTTISGTLFYNLKKKYGVCVPSTNTAWKEVLSCPSQFYCLTVNQARCQILFPLKNGTGPLRYPSLTTDNIIAHFFWFVHSLFIKWQAYIWPVFFLPISANYHIEKPPKSRAVCRHTVFSNSVKIIIVERQNKNRLLEQPVQKGERAKATIPLAKVIVA